MSENKAAFQWCHMTEHNRQWPFSLMASQGRQKKINFKIIYRVPVIDMWLWEITAWEIEITFQEWKTSMRDFKLPIKKEKTLHNITLIMEKNTDVTVHREININCWEWESVAKGYGQKLMESAQHFKRNLFFPWSWEEWNFGLTGVTPAVLAIC